MISQSLLGELADQHMNELRKSAVRYRHSAAWKVQREPCARGESLRVRTGWTLVGFGLRLAVRPGPGVTRTPRPAGSVR